jgi:hypothetical protein
MTGAHLARGWGGKARTQVSSLADVWLLSRMAVWCCVLRLLKHVTPLPRLVLLVRQEPRRPRDTNTEQKVVVLARWASRFTRWSAQGPCLERALVSYRYLTVLNANPVLVIGVAPGERAINGSRGHAWVTVNDVPVDDSEESLEGFASIVMFGPDGHPYGA